MKHRDRLIASVSFTVITLLALPAFANHRHFDPQARNWTDGPFYGAWMTAFADVDGDGKTDAIAVDDAGRVWVRRSNGCKFGPNELWISDSFGGVGPHNFNIMFADVDGDGTADAILLTDSGIKVRRSLAKSSPPKNEFSKTTENWLSDRSYGTGQIDFADVDGDGAADFIAVNTTGVVVRRSLWKQGSKSFGSPENWTNGPYYGEFGTFFADVDGDGSADAIVVNTWGVTVALSQRYKRPSDGQIVGDPYFSPNPTNWTSGPYPSFLGSLGNFFANVLGAHQFGRGRGSNRADAIVVNDNGIAVRESNGDSFLSPDPNFYNWIRINQDVPFKPWGYWTGDAFYGDTNSTVIFADVNGDGRADAIAVNYDGVWVRLSIPFDVVDQCPP